MKIVDLKTFLAMPIGTVFCKYAPCFMKELAIKGENCGERDFFYQDITSAIGCESSAHFSELLFRSEELGHEMKFDFDCESRDGCFKDEQLFAVWNRDDVQALITRLTLALETM